jgi:hypothetical protein
MHSKLEKILYIKVRQRKILYYKLHASQYFGEKKP